jgi:hypothetical protein
VQDARFTIPRSGSITGGWLPTICRFGDRLVQMRSVGSGSFAHDGRLAFHLPARPNEASRGTAERLCRSGSSVTRCYASLNRRSGPATYPAVCSKRATPLDNVHQAASRSARGTDQAAGWLSGQLFGPGGDTTPEFDRRAANTGCCGGATAEKAVPFPCAARRSESFRCFALRAQGAQS